MKKIIDWHRSFVEKAQKGLQLTNCQLYWSGFLKGALFLLVVPKVSFVAKGCSDFPFKKPLHAKISFCWVKYNQTTKRIIRSSQKLMHGKPTRLVISYLK